MRRAADVRLRMVHQYRHHGDNFDKWVIIADRDGRPMPPRQIRAAWKRFVESTDTTHGAYLEMLRLVAGTTHGITARQMYKNVADSLMPAVGVKIKKKKKLKADGTKPPDFGFSTLRGLKSAIRYKIKHGPLKFDKLTDSATPLPLLKACLDTGHYGASIKDNGELCDAVDLIIDTAEKHWHDLDTEPINFLLHSRNREDEARVMAHCDERLEAILLNKPELKPAIEAMRGAWDKIGDFLEQEHGLVISGQSVIATDGTDDGPSIAQIIHFDVARLQMAWSAQAALDLEIMMMLPISVMLIGRSGRTLQTVHGSTNFDNVGTSLINVHSGRRWDGRIKQSELPSYSVYFFLGGHAHGGASGKSHAEKRYALHAHLDMSTTWGKVFKYDHITGDGRARNEIKESSK